jgi:hypothetical protein
MTPPKIAAHEMRRWMWAPPLTMAVVSNVAPAGNAPAVDLSDMKFLLKAVRPYPKISG